MNQVNVFEILSCDGLGVPWDLWIALCGLLDLAFRLFDQWRRILNSCTYFWHACCLGDWSQTSQSLVCARVMKVVANKDTLKEQCWSSAVCFSSILTRGFGLWPTRMDKDRKTDPILKHQEGLLLKHAPLQSLHGLHGANIDHTPCINLIATIYSPNWKI